MTEPTAFYDGRWVPHSQAVIPVADAGFMLGTTVAEQLRTFNGKLFRLSEHLDRLFRSLEIVAVDCGYTKQALAELAEQIVARNHALLPEGEDLGLCMLVTPGLAASEAFGEVGHPLLVMYTKRLAFHLWADRYQQGERLAHTSIRQVPQTCWPAELKCRSRMHYYLADQEAGGRFPGARAIVCDAHDQVLEATTANLLMVTNEGEIVSPPLEDLLPGISLSVLRNLAEQARMPFTERALPATELSHAAEILMMSTSVCVLPCVEVDGQPIGDGKPGPVYQQLLTDWSRSVKVDIAQQATEAAARSQASEQ